MRTGVFLGKQEKNWKAKEKNVRDEEGKTIKRGDRHLFCIEDPFETSHDLGRVMDRDTLRDVRSEIDRAHVMISERRTPWAAVCEQWVNPNPSRPAKKDDSAEPKKEPDEPAGAEAAAAAAGMDGGGGGAAAAGGGDAEEAEALALAAAAEAAAAAVFD